MSDKITAFLAEQKRLADDAEADDTSLFAERSGDWSITSSKRTIVALDKLIESAPRMVNALEALLTLHREGKIFPLDADGLPDHSRDPLAAFCDECTPDSTIRDIEDAEWSENSETAYWPCTTVTAISAALEGDPGEIDTE